MKYQLSQLLLLASIVCLTQARRAPSFFNEPAALARSSDAALALEPLAEQDKHRAANDAAVAAAAAGVAGNTGIKDASSGRLFLKKFLKFKNMFSSNSQPVIPIIITNSPVSTPTTLTSPTPSVTITSTGTLPSATGTITTSPTTPTTTTNARGYNAVQDDDEQADDDEAGEGHEHEHELGLELEQEQEPAAAALAMSGNAELLDEQALQSALAAGAQEYEVFTQGEQADESKATQSNRINLRRKGGRRGQKGEVISVRVPPRYRRYFKNGQKVMLNTKSRPVKRRVVRKRIHAGGNKNKNKNKNNGNKKRINNRRRGGNRNKNRKNKNKRTRIPVV